MDAVLSIAALVFYGRKQGKRLFFGRCGTERPCNAEAHSLELKHNSIYRSIRDRERIGEGSRKMVESIWQEMGLPLLFTVLLLYYAIKLLVFHDVESIRPKERPPVSDRKGYGREAGIFVLIFALISLVASFCMLIHPFLGITLILLGLILSAVQFKRLEEKYAGDRK